MPRSELAEDIKEKIIFHHKSGKGYRSISKTMGISRSTVRSIIRKWKTLGTVMNLPRSGRPTKISARAERKIIKEITKKPDITVKELQASLALAKVKVHVSTITRTLGRLGYVREFETENQCRKEENESQAFEEIVLQKEK